MTGEMKRISYYRRSIFLFVASIGLIAALVYYLYLNADKYLSLFQISATGVVSLSVLSLAFPFFSGISNTYLFRVLGANISYEDGFFLAAASTLANQLPISGGIISKGFYLKRRHDISYAKFFSATLALFFCDISLNGLIGVVVLIYWALFEKVLVSPLLFVGFSLMAISFSIFLLPLEKISISVNFRKWANQVIEGWLIIRKNPGLLFRLVGLQACLMLLLALRYWLSFRMLSQDITITQAVLFASASLLTLIVSIAPGGLGVREAIVGAVALALGFDLGASVVAVGLDRLVSTTVIFVVGGISTIILTRHLSDTSTGHDKPL